MPPFLPDRRVSLALLLLGDPNVEVGVKVAAERERSRASLSPSLPSLNSALDLAAPLLGRLTVAVFIVPVPPLVRRGLRVALGRVLPLLLAPKRSHIEV